MFSKTKIAAVAALALASVAPAFAENEPFTREQWEYLRNPNAPVPIYIYKDQSAPRGQLVEGRNIGMQFNPHAADVPLTVEDLLKSTPTD